MGSVRPPSRSSVNDDGCVWHRWFFVYAAIPLTMLAVLANLCGHSRSSIEAKETHCQSTPMITESLDAILRTQRAAERSELALQLLATPREEMA